MTTDMSDGQTETPLKDIVFRPLSREVEWVDGFIVDSFPRAGPVSFRPSLSVTLGLVGGPYRLMDVEVDGRPFRAMIPRKKSDNRWVDKISNRIVATSGDTETVYRRAVLFLSPESESNRPVSLTVEEQAFLEEHVHVWYWEDPEYEGDHGYNAYTLVGLEQVKRKKKEALDAEEVDG